MEIEVCLMNMKNASYFQLPELTIRSVCSEKKSFVPLLQKSCLLVIGGRAPKTAWLQETAKGHELWAVDHGLDACLAANIRPARLIGDGDSAQPAAWQWAEKQHIPIEKFPVEKDDTDTQLALKLAQNAGFPAALVTGAFGGRFDHALSTVMSCAFAPLPCLLADERETMLFIHAGEAIEVSVKQTPKAISLLPMTSRCEGVNLTGTHWPLSSATLTQQSMRAVSNVLEPGHDALTISLTEGLLGLYFVWHE
jgi:thiamine pyrophosphokinase